MAEKSKPYKIRAHHLQQVRDALQRDQLTDADVARDITDFNGNSYDRKNFLRRVREEPDTIDRRARETVGVSLETIEYFEEGTKSFINKVRKLPDDHPVELISGQPDAICNSCALRETPDIHCREVETAEYDSEILEGFERYARKLGLGDQVEGMTEDVYPNDFNAPLPVRRVKTNMKTVREIVRRGF